MNNTKNDCLRAVNTSKTISTLACMVAMLVTGTAVGMTENPETPRNSAVEVTHLGDIEEPVSPAVFPKPCSLTPPNAPGGPRHGAPLQVIVYTMGGNQVVLNVHDEIPVFRLYHEVLRAIQEAGLPSDQLDLVCGNEPLNQEHIEYSNGSLVLSAAMRQLPQMRGWANLFGPMPRLPG